ncbi:MAG TPA: hypothetical protein VM759_05770 [Longimicrobium sp.]|nr:hypothetical protein [Longimicrobium sp.]
MSDLNVTRRDDDTIPDANPVSGLPAEHRVDSDHLLPEPTHAAMPHIVTTDDPEVARMQIEETRARMSDTIDQIEGVLLRKKEHLEERLDVMAPMRRTARENPYPVVGGVFLAGLVLGLLTGGGDDEKESQPAVRRYAVDFDRERAHGHHWEERAATWERRARRLMDLANRQEAELLELRGESVRIRRRRGRRLFGRGRHDGFGEESFGEARFGERAHGTGGYVDTDTELEVNARRAYDGYGRDPLPAPI